MTKKRSKPNRRAAATKKAASNRRKKPSSVVMSYFQDSVPAIFQQDEAPVKHKAENPQKDDDSG